MIYIIYVQIQRQVRVSGLNELKLAQQLYEWSMAGACSSWRRLVGERRPLPGGRTHSWVCLAYPSMLPTTFTWGYDTVLDMPGIAQHILACFLSLAQPSILPTTSAWGWAISQTKNIYRERSTMQLTSKGLFINDVIIFGGYCDPPLPLVIIRHFSATPPSSRA